MARKNILGLVAILERVSSFIGGSFKKEQQVVQKAEKAHFKAKVDGSLEPANAAAQNQINKKVLIESGQDTPEWLVRRNMAAEQMRAANPGMKQKDLDKILNKEPTFNAPKQSWSSAKTTAVMGGGLLTAWIGAAAGIPTLEGNLAAQGALGYKPGDAPVTLNVIHPVVDTLEALLPGENDKKSLATDRYANALSAAAAKTFEHVGPDGKPAFVTVTPRERVSEAIGRVAHAGLLDSLKDVPTTEATADRSRADAKTADAGLKAAKAAADIREQQAQLAKDAFASGLSGVDQAADEYRKKYSAPALTPE